MYTFEDITITQKGDKITDVEVEGVDQSYVYVDILDETDVRELREDAINFVIGNDKSFMAWSDYDTEEWSTDCYIAVERCNGRVVKKLICEGDMESLFEAINNDNLDVYSIVIDDNLF